MTREELRAERDLLTTIVAAATERPTPQELANAPVIDDWSLFTAFNDLSLVGRITEASGRSRVRTTRAIIALDDDLNWVRFEDGWMRLGPRFGFEPAAPYVVYHAAPVDLRKIRDHLKGQAKWLQMALDALGSPRCDA
ncbi:hypothetical protein DW2_17447 [Thioclava atlantica]|uniref:Uncharacterized protein n=2 Tax=Paracoccaceae TaxID=31989 RepID=A0A085TRY7_9RHOB|nr:hypothetical protein DW2_17447 [Thioclava atlantica]